MASKLSSFLAELKRRKVYHVAVVYVIVGAGIIGLCEAALPSNLWGQIQVPVGIIILVGLPIALVLAWAYEVRPEEPRAAGPVKEEPGPGGVVETVPAVSATDQKKSIVVLPFDNLSPDPGDAYFSDGLTEEIITDLSCCGLLRVISRNSAMALKDTRKGTRAIAEELGVQYVLEGSVRKAGEDLLVTAQLIDAAADEHLWAERFTGTLQEVFEIQGQLSRSIVDSLKVELTSQEEKLLAARPIEDSRAYDAYLLAMHEHFKITRQSTDRAIRLVEEAMAVVGENALLSATLAQLHYAAYDMGVRHDEETLGEIEGWAKKAMELDPELGHSHWAMALVRFKRGDLPGYVRYGRTAVRLSRDGYHCAHLGFVLAWMGKLEEARDLAEDALDRDPLSIFSHIAFGVVEMQSGQPQLALARIGDAVSRLAEGEPFALWWEAQAAGFAGDDDRARNLFEQVVGMEAGALSDLSELFRRALLDDAEGVHEVLDRPDLRDMGNADEWFPVYFASAFARVGEADEAIRWLEQALSWGFSNHTFLAHHNRYLEPLRGDPRFEAIIEQAREKEEALED